MTLAEKLAARYRVEMSQQASRIASLIEEIARLEEIAAQQQGMINDHQQTPDAWGDQPKTADQ